MAEFLTVFDRQAGVHWRNATSCPFTPTLFCLIVGLPYSPRFCLWAAITKCSFGGELSP